VRTKDTTFLGGSAGGKALEGFRTLSAQKQAAVLRAVEAADAAGTPSARSRRKRRARSSSRTGSAPTPSAPCDSRSRLSVFHAATVAITTPKERL
jgi:hypothetical protein